MVGRSVHGGAVVLAVVGAAVVVLAAQRQATERAPRRPDLAKVQSYPALAAHNGVALFALRGLYDFAVRRGELRLGRLRQDVGLTDLRAGARRQVLRVGLSSEILRAVREAHPDEPPPTLAVTIDRRLVPLRGALFGAWHRAPGARWSAGRLAEFERLVGRRLDVDHHFYVWGTTSWPSSRAEGDDVKKGRVPLISLGGQAAFPGLDAISNGSQDAFLRKVARRIRRLGSPVFFRPLWEMNGDWSAWDGSHNSDPGQTNGPAKYVAAWRRMHDIFAREGATNALWVWAPNCSDRPRAAWNHWSAYYPGDAQVDWVGCDGYNRGTAQPTSAWRSFSAIFGATRSVYRDYPGKPFMVTETSSCEQGGSKWRWIDDARRRISSAFPNIKAIVWFDATKLCDWRVSSSSSSLAAYRAMGADPYFNP